MDVAIINYNAGNIFSVEAALKRIGIEPVVTDNAERIMQADRVIFPGVGEARSTMEFLKEQKLDDLIRDLKQPVLGICLGMQLLCKYSEEGDTACLGVFDVPVKRFHPHHHDQKVPHMGWNNITDVKQPLFAASQENEFVYFVHSYYVPVCEHTAAHTDYIHHFSAALHKDNFFATQFHPEKSGQQGEIILRNFINQSL
ncbi:MAG: imidazole glycerol phosphate synthase subunit HisH [Tannerellaceae bacterium]